MRAAEGWPRGILFPQGAVPAGVRPPFSFWSCPKRECAAPGGREKGARRAPVQWPSARDGGRRIGASADLGWPSGTLSSSARSVLPSRGGWCGGQRGARTHLTSVSFRAFRFATRYPGGRGGLYRRADEGVRPYNRGDGFRYPRRGRCPHRPVAEATSTTGQRQRKSAQRVSQTSPGQRIPQGQRVSVPDCRAGPPTIPRRRQEVCACADRPAEAFFSFGPCTARFLFGKTEKKMGGALPSYQHS